MGKGNNKISKLKGTLKKISKENRKLKHRTGGKVIWDSSKF